MKSKDTHDTEATPAAEASPAKSITLGRRAVFAGIGAGAVVALVALVAASLWYQGHQELTRLNAEIDIERAKTVALETQFDNLGSAYARLVSEKRCEVIDGLADCLAAGLARPERFAEADKAELVARGLATPRHALITAPVVAEAAVAANLNNTDHELNTRLPTRPPSGRIKEDVMRQELSKIPGIALETAGPRKPPKNEKQ